MFLFLFLNLNNMEALNWSVLKDRLCYAAGKKKLSGISLQFQGFKIRAYNHRIPVLSANGVDFH